MSGWDEAEAVLHGLPPSVAGVVLAGLAATCFAVQFICIRLGTNDGRVADGVLVALGTNVAVLVPLAAVAHPQWWGSLFTPTSVVSFVLAGLSTSLLARLLMYRSTEMIGASRTTPVISSNVLFATLLAVVFLGETLTVAHLLGILSVTVGVGVISYEIADDEGGRSLHDVGVLLALPLLAAAFAGVEPILVAVGLAEGTPVLPGAAVRVVAATLGYLAYLGWTAEGYVPAVSRDGFRWFLGAGLASSGTLVVYFGALEIAPVTVVFPIFHTNPLVVAVLSAAFLPRHLERVTPRLVAGAVAVVVGASLVTVSG